MRPQPSPDEVVGVDASEEAEGVIEPANDSALEAQRVSEVSLADASGFQTLRCLHRTTDEPKNLFLPCAFWAAARDEAFSG